MRKLIYLYNTGLNYLTSVYLNIRLQKKRNIAYLILVFI